MARAMRLSRQFPPGAVAPVIAVSNKHDKALAWPQKPEDCLRDRMPGALLQRRLADPGRERCRLQRPHLGDGDDLHVTLA